MEALHQLRERQTHIVKRLWSAIERLQAVNQHNLTVKAQEVILIKPLHHFLAVVIESIAQHASVGVFISLRQFRFAIRVNIRPREKLQRRCARHITRQNKAPRLNKMQALLLTLMQIIRPGGGNLRQTIFIGGR
ncbi:hypothetical protein D3C73_1164620 [compost metagenome]